MPKNTKNKKILPVKYTLLRYTEERSAFTLKSEVLEEYVQACEVWENRKTKHRSMKEEYIRRRLYHGVTESH